MASESSNFLYEDGFDALTAVIDVDALQNDKQLNLKINSNKIKLLMRILWCGLLISGSLKRHVTKRQLYSKGQETSSSGCLGSDLVPAADMKLEPLILKGFFKKSICKLAQDECYPDVTCVKGPLSEGFLWGLALLLSLPPCFSEAWAHNHWFLITQTQKISLMQVVAPDEDNCDQNGKPSTPASFIPFTYHHYFHTLLISSKDLMPL